MTREQTESLAQQVSRRIADARRAREWTQEQLAAALDIAHRNLQRMESGRQNFTLETIERVAKVLGVSPESLLPGGGTTLLPAIPGGRAPRVLPVVSLQAAAGFLRDARSVSPAGWCVVDTPREGTFFVARVTGDSMRPLIGPNAYCLFQAPAGPLSKSATYLWQVRGRGAPEDGGSFLVKHYGGRQTLPSGDAHVTLVSANKRFGPVAVHVQEPDQLRAVARFVRTLD